MKKSLCFLALAAVALSGAKCPSRTQSSAPPTETPATPERPATPGPFDPTIFGGISPRAQGRRIPVIMYHDIVATKKQMATNSNTLDIYAVFSGANTNERQIRRASSNVAYEYQCFAARTSAQCIEFVRANSRHKIIKSRLRFFEKPYFQARSARRFDR